MPPPAASEDADDVAEPKPMWPWPLLTTLGSFLATNSPVPRPSSTDDEEEDDEPAVVEVADTVRFAAAAVAGARGTCLAPSSSVTGEEGAEAGAASAAFLTAELARPRPPGPALTSNIKLLQDHFFIGWVC